ncbi:cytochrome b/b6 domain-containing protein, partial [Turicimonas muris]
MSNAASGARILRFHTSDKVFHSINAICWYALFFTGVIVYFGNMMGAISDETANLLMVWHIWLGALFTLNFVGYILFAPDRFAVTMKNLMEWDKNTIMWFRNFGGYPRRFFKIPFGPEEVPPQGRYNGGQKMSYLIFIAAIAYLIVTGWLL